MARTPDDAEPPIAPRVEDPAARLLDSSRAAVYLGVSPSTLLRLINAGHIPIVKLPMDDQGASRSARRLLVDVRDLDRLIERSKETRS